MKKFLLLNVIVATAAAACLSFKAGTNEQPTLAASMKRGEIVFKSYCLACHQANAAGVPNLYPPLIKTKYVLGEKKALVTIVLNGLTGEIEVNGATFNGMMPPHNFLNDQQVADVLTYVRNSFGNKAVQVKPAEVKAVRTKLKL
jgi:mono/diheme cytochrome c family protein